MRTEETKAEYFIANRKVNMAKEASIPCWQSEEGRNTRLQALRNEVSSFLEKRAETVLRQKVEGSTIYIKETLGSKLDSIVIALARASSGH